jgi:hypothetical protein
MDFPKSEFVGAIINRPNAKSQRYPSSVTFGDTFSQREKAFGLCRTKGFSLWEKLSAQRTDEGAVRGCNHGKSDAQTYRQKTFPGGKVAAKRTDEGTGSPCKRRDSHISMLLRTIRRMVWQSVLLGYGLPRRYAPRNDSGGIGLACGPMWASAPTNLKIT